MFFIYKTYIHIVAAVCFAFFCLNFFKVIIPARFIFKPWNLVFVRTIFCAVLLNLTYHLVACQKKIIAVAYKILENFPINNSFCYDLSMISI